MLSAIAIAAGVTVFAVLTAAVILRSPRFRHGRGAQWLEAQVTRHEEGRMRDPLYALLRREVDRVGREYEQLPYERLRGMDDGIVHRTDVVDGVELSFDAEVVSVEANGDLRVCIDANAPERSRGVRSWPSYVFAKRPDGSVYY